MTGPPSGPPSPAAPPGPEPASGDRLDSWKEIAAYLRRDVTTVQRWEKREGMPVHRHVHDKLGSVYASRADLDAWARRRRPALASEPDSDAVLDSTPAASDPVAARRRRRWIAWLTAAAALTLLAVWQLQPRQASTENPLAEARFVALTDFDGIEQSAALSRDGRFVAFLSDRGGQMDVWVTQVGTGQFYNLTGGGIRELVNPSVRTIGFSPDGTLVTFWARRSDDPDPSAIGIWAAPVLGGPPRPYLEGVAEFDWSADGARLVYHTAGPGDPTFVRDAARTAEARQVFAAPPGLHSHFPVWSPDQAFIYFVQGSVPDHMDIWRIKSGGGTPERMTSHDTLVSHPVFLNARTLLYLASDADGSGPWIHRFDVEERRSRRASAGLDRYTSLSASSDGRRLVATMANPKVTLWRVPITGARAELSAGRRIPLTTGNGTSPRLGAGYLLYVSSKGNDDSIWKLQDGRAAELWTAPHARIIGGPAIARDSRRIAFSVRQQGQTVLYVANDDGTDARIVTKALALQGAPAWAPDGRAITVAAVVDRIPRLFNVPLDGGPPARLLGEHAVDPVWTADGRLLLFSGAETGTRFAIKAITREGRPSRLPALSLNRGARHLTFMPGRGSLVVLRGEIRHKNLWLIDLQTGAEQPLIDLPPDFVVRDFDIAPDGRDLVLEQVQDHADLVLLEIPRP